MSDAGMLKKVLYEPFASVGELRRMHLDLLGRMKGNDLSQGDIDEIREFLGKAKTTGRLIEPADERNWVQGILDFWSAKLISLTTVRSDFLPNLSLDSFDKSQLPDLADKPCPFVGLGAFGEKDAPLFFGRTTEIASLIKKVAGEPVVVVHGPSGSGKSSIVFAGLIPKLREGKEIPGSADWTYLPDVVPGNDPIGALLRATCPPGEPVAIWVSQHRYKLMDNGQYFHDLLNLRSPSEPSFLVIDQFEEALTLCEDERAQTQFMAAIAAVAAVRPARHRIVITIREDIKRDTRRLALLAAVLDRTEATLEVGALAASDLQRAIRAPAESVGLEVDDRVVDDLVRRVVEQPAALPLLQFALTKLWERRDHNRITWEVYEEVGTPSEALARTADAFFEALSTLEDKTAAERILLELVVPDVGEEYLRRRVKRERMDRLEASDRIDRVLSKLLASGLVRKTAGETLNDDTFEVVHESLIRNWPRLKGWLEKKRRASQEEIQVRAAARLWRASGRQPGHLLTGETLSQALRFREESALLRSFIDASQARAKNNRRMLVTILVAYAVLATGFAFGLWVLGRYELAEAVEIAERRIRETEVQAEARVTEARAKVAALQSETATANAQAQAARLDAERARLEAEKARVEAEQARVEGEHANKEKERQLSELPNLKFDNFISMALALKLQDGALPSDPKLVALSAEALKSADKLLETRDTQSSVSKGSRGYVWVGTDQDSNLSEDRTWVKPSRLLELHRTYKTRFNLALRKSPPDENYQTGQQIGVVPRGARVRFEGDLKPYHRESGVQYFAEVTMLEETNRPKKSIFLQVGDGQEDSGDELEDRLETPEYDFVGEPEETELANGIWEVRYCELDSKAAEDLAKKAEEQLLALRYPQRDVTLRLLGKCKQESTLELWLDLSDRALPPSP